MSAISPVRARSSSARRASPPRRRGRPSASSPSAALPAPKTSSAPNRSSAIETSRRPVEQVLAPAAQAAGVLRAGPVEGGGDRDAPLHHDRISRPVLDVPAPEVPGGAVLPVDPPEAERPRRLRQQGHPPQQRHLQVGIRLARRPHVRQQRGGAGAHRAQLLVGAVERRLLAFDLVVGHGAGSGGGARR
jgi:hypothetical protein